MSDNGPIVFRLETITPELARKWLDEKHVNREIKRVPVEKYKRDMSEGNWRLVHQCIAFDSTGRLIDGQHRLTAIYETGKTVQAYVAYYSSAETPLGLPIDQQTKRTHADILGVHRYRIEQAMIMMKVLKGGPGNNPTTSEVNMMYEAMKDSIDTVEELRYSRVKGRSSAPSRAACACLIAAYKYESQEIMSQWLKFVNLNLEGTWSSVNALIKVFDGISRSSLKFPSMDIFSRVYYALTPSYSHVKVLRPNNESVFANARETIKAAVSKYEQNQGDE